MLKQAVAGATADPFLRPVVIYRAQARDGSWRWRETSLCNRLDDPIIQGIVCSIRDVTAQQEMLRDLRAADARQRAILTRSRDATMFFDPDGTIRWASPVTTELLGIEPE